MVTLPVGLLRDGRFRLDPLPPTEQQAAIGRLGYGAGVLGKIYLRFPHQFWPDASKWFGRLPDAPDRRGTFNTFVSHVEETGLPILLSFANGHAAVRFDRELDDDGVKTGGDRLAAQDVRRTTVPEPEAFVFPRWLSDPWTRGGYSYPASAARPRITAIMRGRSAIACSSPARRPSRSSTERCTPRSGRPSRPPKPCSAPPPAPTRATGGPGRAPGAGRDGTMSG